MVCTVSVSCFVQWFHLCSAPSISWSLDNHEHESDALYMTMHSCPMCLFFVSNRSFLLFFKKKLTHQFFSHFFNANNYSKLCLMTLFFCFFLKSQFFVLNILNHNFSRNFYFESQFLLKWFTLWQILGFFTNKTKFSKKEIL